MKSRTRHKILIEEVPIYFPGEVINFQVQLPKEAKRIIGMEVTQDTPAIPARDDMKMFGSKAWVLFNSIKVGNLKISASDDEGLAYETEVIRIDNSIHYGDFNHLGIQTRMNGEYQWGMGDSFGIDYIDTMREDWWLAGRSREAVKMDINGENTVLFCTYTDKFYADRQWDWGRYGSVEAIRIELEPVAAYRIKLYLYYEPKED